MIPMRVFFQVFLRLLPLAVVGLILVELVVANELAGLGQSTYEIDRKIENLREENELLGQEIASASALLTIEEKARAMGFRQSPPSIMIGTEEFAMKEPRSDSLVIR